MLNLRARAILSQPPPQALLIRRRQSTGIAPARSSTEPCVCKNTRKSFTVKARTCGQVRPIKFIKLIRLMRAFHIARCMSCLVLYSLRSVLNLDIPLWDFIGKEVLERSQGNIQGDIITHSSRQRCFCRLAGTPDNGENYKGGDKDMGTFWGEINS